MKPEGDKKQFKVSLIHQILTGSLVGLSEHVNPSSSMVPLEKSHLTSGKPDLIVPMWVSRAAGWRGWLGGFSPGGSLFSPAHYSSFGPSVDGRESSPQVWDGGVGPAPPISPHQRALFRALVQENLPKFGFKPH